MPKTTGGKYKRKLSDDFSSVVNSLTNRILIIITRQWTSFLTGASTSFYVYLYSFYYFFFKTKMYGLFQTTFYFGHMALFSLALGIMCGAIGYVGTNAFVRKIYSTIKID